MNNFIAQKLTIGNCKKFPAVHLVGTTRKDKWMRFIVGRVAAFRHRAPLPFQDALDLRHRLAIIYRYARAQFD